jgi:phosphodiesterase/alkaline phosphatase D-like protein
MNVATSSLDTTNATIHWTETGTSTNYTLQYDTVSTFATADSVTVTDTTATLTNLLPNTVYYYRVKSVCGAGDESFWTSGSFRTACADMVIPYTETFDSYSSGSLYVLLE